jgi:DNA-directed RNA polymerase subunit RPC12/RpoP
MRWILPCAGCGVTVQVGVAQVGRPLRCPNCQARVVVSPPASEVAAVPAGRLRLWLAGGAAAVLALGVVISVAYAHWSQSRGGEDGAKIDLHPLSMARVTLGGGERRGFLGGVAVAGPELVTPTITETVDTPTHRLQPGDAPGTAVLAAAGKIPTHLAAVIDPASGRPLVATRDGLLRVHDPATWKEVGTARLDRPAYHLQIDPERRLLYTAASTASALRINELGERGQADADVHVYDLDAALARPAGVLAPAHRFAVGAPIAALILAEDGRHLYHLAEEANGSRLGRIDTSSWSADRALPLRGSRPNLLAQVPGGKTLYALSGGWLYTIDRAAWAPTDLVSTSSSVHGMAVDDRGRVFLAERTRVVQVKVIDVPRRQVLARWQAEAEGLPSVALSPDSNRVFVGTSAFASGRVWILDISQGQIEVPPVLAQGGSDRGRLLRGGLSVTSDGRHLLTTTGLVFRLPS